MNEMLTITSSVQAYFEEFLNLWDMAAADAIFISEVRFHYPLGELKIRKRKAMKISFSAVIAMIALNICAFPIEARSLDASAAPAAANCAALAAADFSSVVDAPTQILVSALAKADGSIPVYCRVQGYVASHVGFELRLPEHWNGKFFYGGCGGFCGELYTEECNDPLRKGYACIVSDMGHRSNSAEAKWAYNNLQAKIDHSYRGVHVSTLAGKAITERYYGKAPNKSYYMGCSTGGRQGLVEAQRFPWDYDGIISIAPVFDLTGAFMNKLWASLATVDKDGHPILTKADAKLVNAAVIASCDMDDGLNDGLISNPVGCKFDISALVCKTGQKVGCISHAASAAVEKIYAGPMTSKGERLQVGGAPPGSELNWIGSYIVPENQRAQELNFAAEEFRYMAFMPDPGPSWKPGDFDFDRDYKRLGMMETLASASNPDLRKYKAAGGKFIAVHGWTDELAPAAATIDYYETMERTMGGRARTEGFFRLFMVPGMNHCIGGNGAFAIDYLTYLEAWVEQGRAPEVMIGAHVKSENYDFTLDNYLEWTKFPLDPDKVSFTRPIYPFPLQAKYKGRGNPNDAASFAPFRP